MKHCNTLWETVSVQQWKDITDQLQVVISRRLKAETIFLLKNCDKNPAAQAHCLRGGSGLLAENDLSFSGSPQLPHWAATNENSLCSISIYSAFKQLIFWSNGLTLSNHETRQKAQIRNTGHQSFGYKLSTPHLEKACMCHCGCDIVNKWTQWTQQTNCCAQTLNVFFILSAFLDHRFVVFEIWV
jgi:hypothetical protein